MVDEDPSDLHKKEVAEEWWDWVTTVQRQSALQGTMSAVNGQSKVVELLQVTSIRKNKAEPEVKGSGLTKLSFSVNKDDYS